MIDLHSHIIPDVDDGSRSFGESVTMLEASVVDGVRAIVAAPHVFSQLSRVKDIGTFREIFPAFREKMSAAVPGIEIFLGCENYFTSDLAEKLREFPDILSVNGGDYFLLEFPMNFIFPGTRDFIFDILNEGHIPVICHPERNTDIQADPSILYEFLVAGALSQADAGSIRGDFGTNCRDTVMKLFKYNLVHIIASDCHDTKLRFPGLSSAAGHLNWIEEEKRNLFLRDVPAAIINNEGIPDIGPLKDPSVSRSFFSVFRRDK